MIKLFLNCLIEQNYKYSKNPQKHAATNKVKFTMSDRQPSVTRGAVQCLCLVAVSYSLPPPGLQPTRLLCPRGFFRLEYWRELPCPPPGIKPRSPPLHADSLLSEQSRKPWGWISPRLYCFSCTLIRLTREPQNNETIS